MRRSKLFLSFAVTSLFISLPYAQAARQGGLSVSETASQKCVDPVTSIAEADEILRAAEVRAVNASPQEKLALASALNTISSKAGISMGGAFHGIKFNVKDPLVGSSGREIAGYSGPDYVNLNRDVFTMGRNARGSAYSESTITHELGHSVANRRGLYPKYSNAVKTRCTISSYCTHRTSVDGTQKSPHRTRNEEFAEVFAAYFYNPSELAQKCPESFKFLNEVVFKKDPGTSPIACSPNPTRRAYQTAGGEYVPTTVNPDPPRKGAPLFFSLDELLKQWFNARELNAHGDGTQEEKDREFQERLQRNNNNTRVAE